MALEVKTISQYPAIARSSLTPADVLLAQVDGSFRSFQAVDDYGIARAFVKNGPVLVSEPIVSPQFWEIIEVYQTPGDTTISIRLLGEPGPIESLVVRIDAGMDLTSNRAHPADRVAAQPVSPGPDDSTFILEGSEYRDSIFMRGRAHVPGTEFDGSEAFNDLIERAAEYGPHLIVPPKGVIYIKNEPIILRSGTMIIGDGPRSTQFVLADHSEQPQPNGFSRVIATAENAYGGNILKGFSVYGNRPHSVYKSGRHAISMGAVSDTIGTTYLIDDLEIIGSAGYGLKMSSDNGFIRDATVRNSKIIFCDSDGTDCKDRKQKNNRITYEKLKVFYWAMASYGTHLEPDVALPTNPITTVAGADTFRIPRREYLPNTSVGDYVSFSSGVTYNSILLNGPFLCVGLEANAIILKAPNAASASGTGGGSGLVVNAPWYSQGDVAIDVRCANGLVDTCYAEGQLYGRNGIRQRGGSVSGPNGLGAISMLAIDCKVVDKSPAILATLGQVFAATAFSFDGLDGMLLNPVFEGNGIGSGFKNTSAAKGTVVKGGVFRNCQYGFDLRGENGLFEDTEIYNASVAGALVEGGLYGESKPLIENPFTPVAIGSNQVLVADPGHTLLTGQSVAFISVVNTNNGIFIERSNLGSYNISNPTADGYTITAIGSATNTDPFGGEKVDVRYPGFPHVASNNTLKGLKTKQSGTNRSAPVILGLNNAGSRTGSADKTIIMDCVDVGSQGRILDYGSNTVWGPGNVNVRNRPIEIPAAYDGEWRMIEEIGIDPAYPVTYLDFNDVDFEHLRLEFFNVQHNSGNSQNFVLYVSTNKAIGVKNSAGDYRRNGAAAGTSAMVLVGAIAANTPIAGAVEIYNFNQKAFTYFDILCGQENGTTGLGSMLGSTTAAEVHTGFRLTPGGGSLVSGTIRLYQRGN